MVLVAGKKMRTKTHTYDELLRKDDLYDHSSDD